MAAEGTPAELVYNNYAHFVDYMAFEEEEFKSFMAKDGLWIWCRIAHCQLNYPRFRPKWDGGTKFQNKKEFMDWFRDHGLTFNSMLELGGVGLHTVFSERYWYTGCDNQEEDLKYQRKWFTYMCQDLGSIMNTNVPPYNMFSICLGCIRDLIDIYFEFGGRNIFKREFEIYLTHGFFPSEDRIKLISVFLTYEVDFPKDINAKLKQELEELSMTLYDNNKMTKPCRF